MPRKVDALLNRETISYLICGILATVVSVGVFWICEASGLHVALSNTISTIATVIFAYFLNKTIVFRSKSWAPTVIAKEMATFIGGRLVTYILETALLVLLVDIMGAPGLICKIFTTVLVVVSNYLISKKAVFIGRSR